MDMRPEFPSIPRGFLRDIRLSVKIPSLSLFSETRTTPHSFFPDDLIFSGRDSSRVESNCLGFPFPAPLLFFSSPLMSSRLLMRKIWFYPQDIFCFRDPDLTVEGSLVGFPRARIGLQLSSCPLGVAVKTRVFGNPDNLGIPLALPSPSPRPPLSYCSLTPFLHSYRCFLNSAFKPGVFSFHGGLLTVQPHFPTCVHMILSPGGFLGVAKDPPVMFCLFPNWPLS